MNLTCINNFSNVAKRTLVNYCQLKDKGRLLLFNNVKIHVINRCKGTKPILYEIQRNKKRSISLYGYILLGIPLASFCLGTWQVQRLQWKLQLIKDLESQLNMEPVSLLENIDHLQDMEYNLVKVKGKFLYENELLLGPRSKTIHGSRGNSTNLFSNRMTTGWNVITPFKVEDQNLVILVNRGWIPQKAKNWFASKTEDVVEIVGVVRKEEHRPPFGAGNNHNNKKLWTYRDINAMANVVGASPIYIDLWSKQDPTEGPVSCQTIVTLRNEHLSYLLTWYTLSVCTAIMWYRAFVRKLI